MMTEQITTNKIDHGRGGGMVVVAVTTAMTMMTKTATERPWLQQRRVASSSNKIWLWEEVVRRKECMVKSPPRLNSYII